MRVKLSRYFVVFSSHIGWEISSVWLPSFPSLFSVSCSSFYGCSFVCGVVVSGGEGVQRKVVVERKLCRCTFFLHVAARRSFLGCAPIYLKKGELLRRYQQTVGFIKTCGLQRTERKYCLTLPSDIHKKLQPMPAARGVSF